MAWVRAAGGGGSDQGTGIALDNVGNIYVAGFFSNTATFGLGELNQTALAAGAAPEIFVAKYDSTGALVWARRAGGSNNDQPTAIVVDGFGNSYVTGWFQLTATFGPGEANQTTLTSAGNNDIFVAKYSSDGTLVWAKRLGGTQPDQGVGIAADASGNAYVTGTINSAVTFGLGEPNQTTLSSGPGINAFLAKYNPDGSLAWAKAPLNSNNADGLGVVLDSSGNVYATGWFAGTITLGSGEPAATTFTAAGSNAIFVAKYNNNGTLVWAKKADAAAPTINQRISRIAVDGTGRSYVTGYFNGTAVFGGGEANQTSLTAASTGGADIFVARYHSDGTLAWVKKAGGGAFDQSYGIAADAAGNSYVTGLFTGTATFGEDANAVTFSLTSTNQDIFVAKYSAKLSQAITFGALATKTYGDPAFVVGATATSGLAVAFGAAGSCSLIGLTVTITGAGSCTITASQAGDDNYTPAPDVQQSFSIAKATPIVTWNNPADITYGTLLDIMQLNATAAFNGDTVSGTLVYNPPSGTVLSAGPNQALTVNFTPFDSSNFNSPAAKIVAINVLKQSQSIAFAPPPSSTFGDPAFNVSATASSGLIVVFGGVGNCSVVGTLVTITGAGSCTVTASQAGDGNYLAATSVQQTFTIAKATPLINWANPADISQETALSGTQLNATATFNGNSVTGTYVYSPPSGTILGAGSSQPLSVTFTPADTANFNAPSPKTVSINVIGSTVMPSIGITATKNHVREGSETNGRFEVSRTGSTSAALTVFYSISGTATNGVDYRSLLGTVTIPAGKSKVTIEVIASADKVSEGSETVILTLQANSTYAVGSSNSATVTIRDRSKSDDDDDEHDDEDHD